MRLRMIAVGTFKIFNMQSYNNIAQKTLDTKMKENLSPNSSLIDSSPSRVTNRNIFCGINDTEIASTNIQQEMDPSNLSVLNQTSTESPVRDRMENLSPNSIIENSPNAEIYSCYYSKSEQQITHTSENNEMDTS
ncbi:hypothetical protein MSG28_004073 [Choristoneura fumiferana]|uniref:Uncharacterized protein n=1 Tax=Choristoneura fumiferana TaxID=7141 RepID=A0ACC0KIA1_CHOFU|nr:hypothetical protein MSG28_004073 [Choristoneura fumiferana]